jgi:hypothetical protein
MSVSAEAPVAPVPPVVPVAPGARAAVGPPLVSIVVPTDNEHERIAECIDALIFVMTANGIDGEVMDADLSMAEMFGYAYQLAELAHWRWHGRKAGVPRR